MAEVPSVPTEGTDSEAWPSTTFDHASDLFEKNVPVCFKGPGRTPEKVEELSFRILLGFDREKQAKVLSLQVTSEVDPFFFHHLEVSEDEFQALKIEQSILVDFMQFPQKFIELLEACMQHCTDDHPKFLAVMRVGETCAPDFSNLGIVETNDFKHLSHISLRLKRGSDKEIKHYLAMRLMNARCDREKMMQRCSDNATQLDCLRRQLEESTAEVYMQREICQKSEEARQSQLNELSINLKAAAMKELENTRQKLEGERIASETAMGSAIDSLKSRNSELDSEVRDLMETKYKLDSRLSDVVSRLHAAESELQTSKIELARLKKTYTDLDKDWHARERSTAQHGLRIEWLEQQLKDKEDLIASMNGRLHSAETQEVSRESALENARATAARAEERISASAGEIRKGNQIIERLQAELRSAKAKARLKAAIIAQQEKLLNERQDALDKSAREISEFVRAAETSSSEIKHLRKTADEHRLKLEESHSLLASNQQMIQWLNSQINDAQLGRLKLRSGSSYRPSTLVRP